MHVKTAPEEVGIIPTHKYVFLAGTIENGNSTDWQAKMEALLQAPDTTLINPRRIKWNPAASAAEIDEQIAWEQRYLMASTHIFFNFLPGTMSMISLLELGQMIGFLKAQRLNTKHVVVCCPREYVKFDNVFAMCVLYKIPIYTDFDLAIRHLNIRLNLK